MTPPPLVDVNKSIETRFPTVLVVCPQCEGHGSVRVKQFVFDKITEVIHSCEYCRGERVIETRVHHQHFLSKDG